MFNSADKPGPVKKAVTPQHRKALNRPRRRLVQVDKCACNYNELAALKNSQNSINCEQITCWHVVFLTKSVSFSLMLLHNRGVYLSPM